MMTSQQPLVGIVTPVYNNALHLPEAIESVLNQEYQNWEYIIVNNCSTDGSGEIARKYAARDPRIRVIDNVKFLGAIANHNHALREVSPEAKYIKMVFADDLIFPECLQRMVDAAEAHPSVGLIGGLALQGSKVMWGDGLRYPADFVNGRVAGRMLLRWELFGFGPPNAVLYRADLVRKKDPFFNEDNIHADTEAALELLKESDYSFLHQVLSLTRERDGSLTAKSIDIQTYLPGMLQLYDEHADTFLPVAEIELLRSRHLHHYYRFLGWSLLTARNAEFWEYHKRKLRESKQGFRRHRVVLGAIAAILDGVLNPKRSLDRLRQRVLSEPSDRLSPESPAAPQAKTGDAKP